jgi:hypothetical protein
MYRGVKKIKNGKFKVELVIHGKYFYLGLYENPETAAKVYDKFIIENNGRVIQLNFPEVYNIDKKAVLRQREKQRRLKKEYKIQSNQTNEGNYFNILCSKIKSRALIRGLDFNLTPEYVRNVYLNQNKKCAITGISLYYPFDKERNNINGISVDRVDSTKGYTEDNIQIVSLQVNKMKSDLSMNDFIHLCELTIKNKEVNCA